jgi:uncharacterized protein
VAGAATGADAADGGGELHLRVGVSELRRRPGNRRRVERLVPLDGLAISTASVVAGEEGRLDVTLESLTDGVTATGSVRFRWEGPCRRCLEPTGGTIDAPIREVFADRPEGGDVLAVEGDAVDLGPVVRDAVVLALPMAPLCRDDCPGPDPEHFPVVAAEESAEAPADPRWAALSELRFDPGEPEG